MRGIKQTRPTPAFIIAIVALVAALGGGAVAGVTVSALNKKEKKQVRKIAGKKVRKQVKKIPAGPRGLAGPKGADGDTGPKGSDANALQFVSVKDLNGTGTRFLPVSGWVDGGEASGPDARSVAAGAFTATDLRVRLNTAVQFGNSRTFTFQKNGSPTALTCSIGSSEAGCSSGESVAVAADDTVQIRSEVTGSPNPNGAFVGWRSESP